MTATLTDYNKQAQDFLTKHHIALTVSSTGKHICPPFCDGKHIHGMRYSIFLTSSRDRLSFPFWNSLNDAREGKAPTTYDVLACISSDAFCPNTFEDFCAEYGYDADSRKAFKTWKNCADFAERLCNFFSDAQLADLAEIS